MRKTWLFLLASLSISCGGTHQEWARGIDIPEEYRAARSGGGQESQSFVRRTLIIGERAKEAEPLETPLFEGDDGRLSRGTTRRSEAIVLRNTYYDFPAEGSQGSGKTLYDAKCRKIADVSASFHDTLCIQGSGKIASGQTVSFARRNCECASVCPRTGQRICFEALDPVQFPWGRGARGTPITPLSTVAVDTSVVPFGTRIFIPEAVGLPRGDGSLHDGCFIAEDRGLKIVGDRIDIFTGDPAMTAVWNARLPSHRGLEVRLNAPECAD